MIRVCVHDVLVLYYFDACPLFTKSLSMCVFVLNSVIFRNFYDSCNNLTFVFHFAKILHISHIMPWSRSQEIVELFLLTLLVPWPTWKTLLLRKVYCRHHWTESSVFYCSFLLKSPQTESGFSPWITKIMICSSKHSKVQIIPWQFQSLVYPNMRHDCPVMTWDILF